MGETEFVSTLADRFDAVVVMDAGARQSQLVARSLRTQNVYCELWPPTTSLETIRRRRFRGVILPEAPDARGLEGPVWSAHDLVDLGVPVLAMGGGAAWMADQLGEAVGDRSEVGMTKAKSGWYGVERPWEELGEAGDAIVRGFAVDACRCEPDWSPVAFIDAAVAEIRRQVGSAKALCGLSGGVDSSVAAALVHRAVGDQLTSIFVDHGLLRQGESEQVVAAFGDRFGPNFRRVDASDRFLTALEGVRDPEAKRKAIGEAFIRVFEEEAQRVGDARFLVQGTLYPDVIESGYGGSATIKSHHNVGGLPETMQLELLEPLRFLFKDEARAVGEALGLPAEMVWRQPFPGPGLAIRIMGPVDREKLAIERTADAIVVEEIARAGLDRDVWQCFAVLTETRSVGIQGDERSYGYVAAVRAVASVDGMGATWARLPHDLLDRIAQRIMNEAPQVSRVVYDISSKPPATIEWE